MQNHSSGFGKARGSHTHVLRDIPLSGPAPGSRGTNHCQSGPKTRQLYPLLERNLCCMRAIHAVLVSLRFELSGRSVRACGATCLHDFTKR